MAGSALRCEDACILHVEDAKEPEKEKRDTVVHVNKHGNGSLVGEKVCRICHLGSECSAEVSDLVQLGCGCKDELGVSHLRCAETWFKQKGNRLCEICGESATNVTGMDEAQVLVVEFNQMGLIPSSSTTPFPREGGCSCQQALCNMLLACVVLAFVVLWFFRP
ncbi:hypothetical protein RJ639_026453 [Escallonia herrerae]|uniref:RING-CH-type domain-containing protein n=1 Tax=Escallonia herrerae TaxID=1293975 RepID=A0AA89ACX7_9ASTE|nr:hypothetical protein RJ639_026453 [Escallonia herrerae]